MSGDGGLQPSFHPPRLPPLSPPVAGHPRDPDALRVGSVLQEWWRCVGTDRTSQRGAVRRRSLTQPVSCCRKRIKGFCGAQPPQKPRWTNAGVGVALWRFHSERMVSMLKMLPQAARILALG